MSESEESTIAKKYFKVKVNTFRKCILVRFNGVSLRSQESTVNSER